MRRSSQAATPLEMRGLREEKLIANAGARRATRMGPVMVEWTRDDSGLAIRDIERRQPYKLEPHEFGVTKKLPWARCKRCGLLTLRNDFTAWVTRMGCNASDHPEYAARCRNTKPRNAS